LQSKCFSP